MHNLTYSITDAANILGIGKTKLYSILAKGDIRAKKIGKRTLIRHEDLKAFIDNLEQYPSQIKEG